MDEEQPIIEAGETFDTGTEVPASGTYVCAPCGYTKRLEQGGQFPECDSCMGGTVGGERDEDDAPTPSGIWEYRGGEGEDETEGEEGNGEDE